MNIEQLKRDAKRLKKQESITHAEALDRIAQQHGFKNWAALMRVAAGVSLMNLPPMRFYVHGDKIAIVKKDNTPGVWQSRADFERDPASLGRDGVLRVYDALMETAGDTSAGPKIVELSNKEFVRLCKGAQHDTEEKPASDC